MHTIDPGFPGLLRGQPARYPARFTFTVAALAPDLQVSEQVGDQVREQTRKQSANEVSGEIFYEDVALDSVPYRIKIADLISENIFKQVRDQIHDPSGEHVDRLRAWPFRDDFGQFDVSLSWFDFVGRLGIDVSKLAPTFDLAKACGWAVLFWDWAFISAKPECIHRDAQGRLHCETGAAVRYPDGFSVFAIHGVRVPEKIAVSPESITISGIESEGNAEVRRVMIERYGREQYLVDSQAKEIHRDDFGILYRKDIMFDEPLVMVKVVNSTPEPDGSYKDYFLRVPPTMERARQAVAWTFGKEENEYAPAFQT